MNGFCGLSERDNRVWSHVEHVIGFIGSLVESLLLSMLVMNMWRKSAGVLGTARCNGVSNKIIPFALPIRTLLTTVADVRGVWHVSAYITVVFIMLSFIGEFLPTSRCNASKSNVLRWLVWFYSVLSTIIRVRISSDCNRILTCISRKPRSLACITYMLIIYCAEPFQQLKWICFSMLLMFQSLPMQARDCKCHRLAISLSETLNSLNFEADFRKAVQSLTAVSNCSDFL